MMLFSLAILMYELDVKVSGLMIGLLSMFEVMAFHICIALVDVSWHCEQGFIM